jgi:hypothetical protein
MVELPPPHRLQITKQVFDFRSPRPPEIICQCLALLVQVFDRLLVLIGRVGTIHPLEYRLNTGHEYKPSAVHRMPAIWSDCSATYSCWHTHKKARTAKNCARICKQTIWQFWLSKQSFDLNYLEKVFSM